MSSGAPIEDLQGRRALIEERLLRAFSEESIGEFQTLIKVLFLGEDRAATKAYLKLFIEKIVINLPRMDSACKFKTLPAALENKTAARTGVLTAGIDWLPSADSNHGPDG